MKESGVTRRKISYSGLLVNYGGINLLWQEELEVVLKIVDFLKKVTEVN